MIEISRLIDAGILRPIVGDVLSMDDVRQAYERKPVHGKNVLRITER